MIGLSVVMLGSAPGTARLGMWVESLDDGMSLEDVANHIAASDAFLSTYPSFLTNEEFADAFLTNLGGGAISGVLLSAAVDIVVGLLNDGMSRGELALAAMQAMFEISEQGADHPAYGDLGPAADALINRVSVAEYYTVDARMEMPSSDVLDGVTDDMETVTAAQDAIDNPPPPPPMGETFTLTNRIDRLTGTDGDDTFTGTLTRLDNIDGGDGEDTLDISNDSGSISIDSTVRVANVENLVVNSVGAIKGNAKGWGLSNIDLEIIGNEPHDPDGTADSGDEFNLAVDLNAGGAAVTAMYLDGVVCIQDASTVDIHNATATSVVKIGSGAHTTEVYVKGGESVDVGKMFAARTGTFPGVTGASETVASVSIDGVASAASIDFDADNTDDGSIRIVSEAIESVSLANTYGTAQVTNGSKEAEDIALTVNKYGGQMVGDPAAPVTARILLDGTGAAENVSIDVAGASRVNLSNDATKMVSISGSEALVLTVNKADGTTVSDTLESISVSGDAGLTFIANAHSKLETIDASGSMGKNNLTITDAAELTMISTGGGDDTVTVTAAAKLESISTGGGADKVTVNAAHRSDGLAVDLGMGDDTYTVGTGTPVAKSTIMGGAGTDVLAMTDGANSTAHVNATGASIYSGFEVLAVGGGSGSYDLEKLGLRSVVASGADTTGGGVSLVNVAAGTTVTVNGTGAAGTAGTAGTRSATISYALKDSTGKADSMTVNLMTVGGKDDMPDSTAGANDFITSGQTTLGLTADGIETLVINSSVTAGGKQMASAYTNAVNLAATASTIKSLDINGAGKVTVDANAITTLTMVDATGNSAGATVSATGATARVTFNGGAGDDMFTGGTQRDILNGGGGKDMLVGGDGDDIITGGAGADTLTGGAGADSFRFTSASDSRVLFGKGGAASGFDMITDWATGTNVIALSRSLGVTDADLFGSSAILEKAVIADTDTPANAVDDLMDYIGDGMDFFSDGVDDKAIAFAADAANGYIFIDVNGNGDFDVATDMVIRLDGVITAVDGSAFDIV